MGDDEFISDVERWVTEKKRRGWSQKHFAHALALSMLGDLPPEQAKAVRAKIAAGGGVPRQDDSRHGTG